LSLSYVAKESFSGFKRAKISGFITIFTITISLFLLSIFMFVFDNTNKIVQHIRNRIEIEVFLIDTLTQQQTAGLKAQMAKIEGVDSVKYISKDEAASIFKQEFGEDINQVLDFNPLPPSFKIAIKDEYKTSENIKQITKDLSSFNGVDEVVYRKTLLELLDKRSKIFWQISLGLGIFIGIVSIFLVSNTIRLIIYSKRKIITTMKLVGATERFIRTPFIMEGVVHGLVAGIISSILLFLIIKFGVPFLGEDIASLIYVNDYFYLLIILLGGILGLIGSFVSVRMFITKAFKS
jgi:cell division transport system permease protein